MLNPSFRLGDLDLTASPYAVEFGSDLGAPENAYEVVMSLLQDGDAVTSDRAGNREVVLTVLVEGGNLRDLALAEAALIAETEKPRNVLTVDPGDGLGVPTAFDTFRAQATLARNDDEEQHFLRRYELTIPALPYGRSTAKIVTTTQPVVASPTYVTLDTLDSATGWTGSKKWPGLVEEAAVTPTSSGGALVVSSGTSEHPRVIDAMNTVRLSWASSGAVNITASGGANVVTWAATSSTLDLRWAGGAFTSTEQYLVLELATPATGWQYASQPPLGPVRLIAYPAGSPVEIYEQPTHVADAPSGGKYYFFSIGAGRTFTDVKIQLFWQTNQALNSHALTLYSILSAPSTAVGSFTTALSASRATAYTMSGMEYLIAEWQTTGGSPTFVLSANGSPATMISDRLLADGWRRSVYRVSGNTAVSFRAEGVGLTDLKVRELIRTNSPEGVGSPRQQNLTIDVGGSIRTQGDIALTHAGAGGLGDVIVYTYPSGTGASPALRPWLVSADTVTSDTALVSGARNGLTGVTTFRVPVKSLIRGRAQLWARVSSSGANPTLSWSVASYMGAAVVGPTTSGSTQVTASASTYTIVPLADVIVPPTKVGESGFVQITLQRGDSNTITLDEAWLFSLEEGDLTVVQGTTGVADRLWIDAPSLDNPVGGVEIGQSRAVAFYPSGGNVKILSSMDHHFAPGGSGVFIVTTNTLTASAALEHYKRWHTHAVD